MKFKLLLAMILLPLLNSCTVGPNYKKPSSHTSKKWLSSQDTKAVIDVTQSVQTRWWQAFNDSTLTGLIQTALKQNLDIKIAEAKIKEARALRGGTVSGFYPKINGNVAAGREKISENSGIPVGAGIPINRDYYNAGFDASWELDIFGGLHRSVESADAHLVASVESKHDVLLSLLSEISRNYMNVRGTQRRLEIARRNIVLQGRIVEIIRQRYHAGNTNELELAKAEAQLHETQAVLPNLIADLRSYAYRLAILLAQEPQTLLKQLLQDKPLPVPPDIIPVGLQSDILRRRPDIRRAERLLAAETADIGVATAELFPKFSLTGNAGLQSLSFGNLFQSGSTAWALGPLIQWPIFHGGEIHARIKVEEVQAAAAALNYEKAVLGALEDTQTALVRYGEEFETRKRLSKVVVANQKSLNLAEQRYKLGEDNIISVFDITSKLLRAEDNLARSQTRTLINLISLYKALGGGWEVF